MRKRTKKVDAKGYEGTHTTVMSLVFIAHVPTVIVSITDPGGGDAPAVITAKLVRVAGPSMCGCRDNSKDIKLLKKSRITCMISPV